MSLVRMPVCVQVALSVLLVASFTAGQSVPDVLYYKFNEGSGSSTANVAVPGQGSTNPSITGHQLSAGGGQFGGSLAGSTSGTGGNRVNTNWVTNLGSGSWTIGFWIHLHGVAGPNPTELMYVFGDPTAGQFRCYINSSAGAGNVRMRGPLTELGSVGGPLLTGGHYVHWVYNAASTNLSLYIDGSLNGNVSQPGGLSINGSAGFQVAGYNGGGSPQSLRTGVNLDEFRVYSSALSAAEISQTWNTTLTPSGLFADFTSNTTSGPSPLVVSFQDTSTTTAGSITSWAWDFGDGATSSQANPTHTYGAPGTYTVTLTVTDGTNPPATRIKGDYITAGPFGFNIQTSGGGVGDLVLTAAPSPPGTTEGYTFFSTTPASTLGQGNFFGIMFDNFVVTSLSSPALPGNPFHFVPSSAYPSAPFILPPGSLVQYAGITADAVVVYLVNGQIVSSQVDRATF